MLYSAEEVVVQSNPKLRSLTGLNRLAHALRVTVRDNSSLEELDLSGLGEVEDYVHVSHNTCVPPVRIQCAVISNLR